MRRHCRRSTLVDGPVKVSLVTAPSPSSESGSLDIVDPSICDGWNPWWMYDVFDSSSADLYQKPVDEELDLALGAKTRPLDGQTPKVFHTGGDMLSLLPRISIPSLFMDCQRNQLRKVKPFHFGRVQDNTPTLSSATWLRRGRRLLRVHFRNPEDDYTFVHELHANQGTLVCHRKHRLHIVVMRESFSPTPLNMLEDIAQVKHPNIADILDVFSHEGTLCVVSEHLAVSILDLEFRRLAPEEWEIATIIAELIKGMNHLLDTLPTSELNIDSVRVSLQGDVKLVPDMYYESSRQDKVDHEYSSAFLAVVLEVLMSHGTSSDTGWSQAAIEFSTIPASDSLAPFMNHIFMRKAVSSSRLIPRVRLATQMLGRQPQDHLGGVSWFTRRNSLHNTDD